MFLFKGDTLKHETEIRGVKYITVSYYNGDRDIFEKIGGLIAESKRPSSRSPGLPPVSSIRC